MENNLPSFGTPCPFLKVGQCPDGDGCEYAHDFIAQPCLSAAQIDYQMRGLEDARSAGRIERAKAKRRRTQLCRLGARKLAAPSLIERGILPTRKAIKHELGRYTVGPPNRIPSSAVRERGFVGGRGDDGGEWLTVELNRMRRERKILTRIREKNVRIRGMSGRSGANRNPPTKAAPGVSEGVPGVNSPPVGGASFGYTTTTTRRGNMDVGEEEIEISRRVEIIGDFTVKYPTAIPLHLRHRHPNASPATTDSPPPPQNQLPHTDEGITYAPPGEIVHEIGKEYVTIRERALSF